jgi:hypothetical protein
MFIDGAVGRALGPLRQGITPHLIAIDGSPVGTPIENGSEPRMRNRAGRRDGGRAVNVIYFVRHDGHAERHRPAARDALGASQRGASYGYGPVAVTLLSTPLHSNTTLVVLLSRDALGGTVVLDGESSMAGPLPRASRNATPPTPR